ncbi:hypothetical protein BGZ52_001918 [Haplosporangium bisporale]|nr:hypothetical protein BGZ52_001918 [Haplosporangium bisporale]
MVRLSLSFLSVASAFAVASAAPFFSQQPFTGRPISDAQCLRDSSINEYQSFKLWSRELQTYLSGKSTSDRLVGGVNGDKNLEQIEFCAVSSDDECDSILVTGCILEDLEYRLRISRGPLDGYLRVDGHYVRIVSHFEDASLLSFNNDGFGLRIFHSHKDDEVNVLATSKYTENGQPVVLEYPQRKRQRQRFDIVSPYDVNTIEFFGDNECVPEISLREYQPFLLKSTLLNTIVSQAFDTNLVVGGINGDKDFKQLELCLASTDRDCSSIIQSDCIYQNQDYRFRVNAPVRGYLRLVNGEVDIVEDFDEASALSLFKEAGWPLRISGRREQDGKRVVLAASERGGPITVERPKTDAIRQWFEIIEANYS